jgi:hypothetical protein
MKPMKFSWTPRWSFWTLGATIVLATGTARAALYGFGPAEAWTIEQIANLTAHVASNISTFGTTFNTNMVTKFENLISAIAVATKQEALAANAVSEGSHDSAQQLVNAVRVQRQNDAVTRAYLDFNPSTAQGYQPCLVAAQNRTLDGAFDKISAAAQTSVAALDVAPGHLVKSASTALAQRLGQHRSQFCTQSEADAGLCTLSQLPGGDTNAELLFEPTAPDSLQQKAQMAYIQNVLGGPDAMVSKTAGPTPQGQTYMQAKNSKDALLSIPAYSLSMVQAANTQSPELQNKSPNEVLALRVNQYFGGKEAQEWSSTLTAQSERGLMVEAVKMAGLEVWLHHKQYEQNQRLEMNMAALSMIQGRQAQANVDDKYDKMMRDTVTGSIK